MKPRHATGRRPGGTRVRLLLPLLLLAALPPAGRAQETPASLDRLPSWLSPLVRSRIERTMRRQGLVGMSVALIRDREIVFARGFGFADRERRIPADAETKYRWASISKCVTAVAALQLVERGKLDLGTKVRDYLPAFPKKPWPIPVGSLLSHMGGIVHYDNGKVVRTRRDYGVPHPFTDLRNALDLFQESPLVAEPGTRFSYSTYGYVLLGAVLREAGGAPYWTQVRERIAKPLGMNSFEPDYPWKKIEGRAKGYRLVKDGSPKPSTDTDVSWKLPGGGFLSNVLDLARFGKAVLRGRLLEPGSYEAAFRPARTKEGKTVSYGMGFSLGTWRGVRVVGHSGAQEKTRTRLALLPETGVGVALMCNTEGARLGKLARDLADLCAPDGIRASITHLASPGFGGRGFGTEENRRAARWIAERFEEIGLEPLEKGSWFLEFDYKGKTGRNVCGVLRSSREDADWVLVAAHHDHLGRRNGRIRPGADDNASGVAMMLALARALASRQEKPDRNFAFLSFDAEEKGLVGSRAFVRQERLDPAKIRFLLVFDLCGGDFLPWRRGEIYAMGAEHSPEVSASLRAATPRKGLRVLSLGTWVLEPLGPLSARSDYAAFRARGVPYLFLSSATPWYYHTPFDTPDRLDYEKLAEVRRFSLSLLERIAGLPKRPSFIPRPRPRGKDGAALLEALEDALAHARNLRLDERMRKEFEAVRARLAKIEGKETLGSRGKRTVWRALALLFRAVASWRPPRGG